jgi:ketosteroid isomerase-like protein
MLQNRQYADDYTRIGNAGRVQSKAEAIKAITNPNFKITTPVGQHLSDVRIRMYGNVAVVTALTESTLESKDSKTEKHSERILRYGPDATAPGE